MLCSLGLWFHVKEQKEVWLKWIYHLISWVQPVHQHSDFVVSQSQAPALPWGKISYCMSGVGPSILCYVPKSPNGHRLETPVRYLKGGLWSQSQELHEFRPIRPLLSTSDKEKVHACVPRRWNDEMKPYSLGTALEVEALTFAWLTFLPEESPKTCCWLKP